MERQSARLKDELHRMTSDDRPEGMSEADAITTLEIWRAAMSGEHWEVLEGLTAEAARKLGEAFAGWRLSVSTSQAIRDVELELTQAAIDNPAVSIRGVRWVLEPSTTKLTLAEAERLLRNEGAPTVQELLAGARWLLSAADEPEITPLADPSSGEKPGGDSTLVPKQFLFNWQQIHDALGRENTDENKRLVEKLNKVHAGPIIVTGRGSSPKVDKVKLLEWWNSLEDRFNELKQRATDRTATVAEQSNYGRDGTVYHDISGHEKKRRGNDS